MNPKKLIVSASPHTRFPISTSHIMALVAIALLPTAIASGMIFGPRALLVIAVTVAACVGFEALYCIIMKKEIPVGDFSAVVTGIILAFNLPASIPLWIAIVGAFVAIVIVKQLFGGIGLNFANPALVGRIVLTLGFTSRMTAYVFPAATRVDALASATPLAAHMNAISSATPQFAPETVTGTAMLQDLLLGTHGGMIGETCAVTLILGGIFLVAFHVISPVIPLSYLGTVAVMSLVLGQDVLLQLLSGGLLLGAIFMATDYVTSPFTTKGKLIFGICLGILTCLIRFYGNMTEGVSFSLLLMNLLVPYINQFTRQVPLGGGKQA